jgi:putative ABC transport system permease protein
MANGTADRTATVTANGSRANRSRIEELRHDIRYAFRLLKRSPGFSAIAILTLGLGIGANTAIFSVINTVFLRALPYPEPQRLVQFNWTADGNLGGSAHDGPAYFFLRDHLRSYTGIASAMTGGGVNLVLPDQAVNLRAISVTADYFRTLGVEPALGRSFTATEDVVGGANVVILSHALWREYFHGDPGVLQQTVNIGGTPHEVAGVMPADFIAKPAVDVWLPLRPGGHDRGSNREVVARLLPGVTIAQAQSEMDNLLPGMLHDLNIKSKRQLALRLMPYLSDAGSDLRLPLLVLMGAVAMVLLMACANLANLLLARAAGRTREMAVRAALGASRGRIVRQLLVESVILSLAGGLTGLLLARWTLPALLRLSPIDASFWGTVSLDRTVLGFTLLLSLLTGLVFGLAPAFQLARLDLNECFKEGGRATTSRRAGRLRQLLVVSEVALSVTLLVVALLLVRTFTNLMAVNPGFDPHRLLVAGMTLRGASYDTTDQVATFYRLALERLRQSPSIESAAVILNPPMTRGMNTGVAVLNAKSDGQFKFTDWRYITTDYFAVMHTPLIAGRAFTDRDTAGAARVAIVNQTFARKYLGGENPIGQQIDFGGKPEPGKASNGITTIVGLAPDMKQQSLGSDVPPIVYTPLEQTNDSGLRLAHGWFTPTWLIRSRDDGASAATTLQQTLRAIDPQQPLVTVRTMETMIDRSLTQQRFQMLLIGSCALLALVLAAAGLFGVISYAVAQRAHEMGIRLALGATSSQLVGGVVGQGAILALVGIVLGLLGAGAASRLLTSFMFGISATDPSTFVIAAVLLLGIAMASSAVPAWRITRLDPATTLRQE